MAKTKQPKEPADESAPQQPTPPEQAKPEQAQPEQAQPEQPAATPSVRYIITVPFSRFEGDRGGVQFRNGTGTTTDKKLAEQFGGLGYGVRVELIDPPPEAAQPPEAAKTPAA